MHAPYLAIRIFFFLDMLSSFALAFILNHLFLKRSQGSLLATDFWYPCTSILPKKGSVLGYEHLRKQEGLLTMHAITFPLKLMPSLLVSVWHF